MQSIRELYTMWNNELFEGKLSTIPLAFYARRSKTQGFFRFRRSFGTISPISININTFNSPIRPRGEKEIQYTLLHEMVHAFLCVTGRPSGHTPLFKAMLKNLTEKAFGFRPTGNVRFTVPVMNSALQAPVAPAKVIVAPVAPTVTIVAPTTATRYKVLSNGIVGTFRSFSTAWGKKMITLDVAGEMFPFVTELSNVVAI